MKRILSLIIVLAMMLTCTLSMVSCGEETVVPDGMKYACNPDIVDYSLFVPENWIVDITTGSSMAHVSESDFSSVQVSQWNLTNELKNYDTWWADYKSSIEKLGVVEYVTELENTVVNEIASKKCEYKLTLGEGTDDERTYSYMVVGIITRGSVYVFLYTSLEDGDLYNKNMPTVEQILKEFKFN
ncbi:MAG: hypothetical protein IJV68_03600 [Clostridia bacterium]|nr:hypothetical protein [Clostridia bacterium]MBQ9703610.1 hypothetical protein [Clostridia bacterium]